MNTNDFSVGNNALKRKYETLQTQDPVSNKRGPASSEPSEIPVRHGTSLSLALNDIDDLILDHTQAVSRSGVGPVFSTTPRLGGKVMPLDARRATGIDWRQSSAQIHQAVLRLLPPNTNLTVVGYHTTTRSNAEELAKSGFDPGMHAGKGGGVAGRNIRGPGLYASTSPLSEEYQKPDQDNVVYAVVVNKSDFEKFEKFDGRAKAWESDNSAWIRTTDYCRTYGEIKFNPRAIGHIGLMPIRTIPRKIQSTHAQAPQKTPPTALGTEAADWLDNAVAKEHERLDSIIQSADPEHKLDALKQLAYEISGRFEGPKEKLPLRLVVAQLKQRVLLPA